MVEEGTVRDEQQQGQCVNTTNNDDDDNNNNEDIVPIFALFYWPFYPLSGW